MSARSAAGSGTSAVRIRGWDVTGSPRLVSAAQVADMALTLGVVARFGPEAEANPLVAAVLGLGVLGLVAWKCSLLAVILSAAVLNPRYREVLLLGGLVSGSAGAVSGLVALL